MALKIYINGKFYEKKDAKISVFDHGLLYGDGVFEGIRSYNRLVFKLKEHIDRLYESAHSIMLEVPLIHKEMMDAVILTLKVNKLSDSYIRVVVTRGEGDLGLDPRKCKGNANIIIIADKMANLILFLIFGLFEETFPLFCLISFTLLMQLFASSIFPSLRYVYPRLFQASV